MTTILSTVLLTAPIAFLAGWILAKSVFRYMGSDARVADYRKLLEQEKSAAQEQTGQIAELHAEIRCAARATPENEKEIHDLAGTDSPGRETVPSATGHYHRTAGRVTASGCGATGDRRACGRKTKRPGNADCGVSVECEDRADRAFGRTPA